jgi:hypothetical protein
MDQPSCKTYPNGDKAWYLNGILHRTDGPAFEWADGSKAWLLNGKYHRTDGPAVEGADGSKEWWLDGKFHRPDGPAVERTDGSKAWWLDDEEVPWQIVYHQAKEEDRLSILIAALTTF